MLNLKGLFKIKSLMIFIAVLLLGIFDSLVKTPICSSFYIMFLGVGVLEAYLLLQVVFYQRTLLAQGVFTDESFLCQRVILIV
jgi:hypothetical protein